MPWYSGFCSIRKSINRLDFSSKVALLYQINKRKNNKNPPPIDKMTVVCRKHKNGLQR